MLPTPEHVKTVYTGSGGILEHFQPGSDSILIDCSTIGPVAAKEVMAVAENAGVEMVDAPVSGGCTAAEAATLTFMVGAADANYERARKLLAFMGGTTVHCGPPGVGQAVKVCNNLILAASMLGVAEGFRLAEALGVDLKKFAQVVNQSSGRCWTTQAYSPVPGLMENVPSARSYAGGFASSLMVKDLDLALKAAESAKIGSPTAEACSALYHKVVEAGHGDLDFGCVFLHNK
eukprot:GHVT01015702.1.p1 GENE.GHVT01015702.1~~GHVT01015702.1.p1  ORF type:complete len:233 (+),score=49.44 GHVT01015702.1:1967-2665(+)